MWFSLKELEKPFNTLHWIRNNLKKPCVFFGNPERAKSSSFLRYDSIFSCQFFWKNGFFLKKIQKKSIFSKKSTRKNRIQGISVVHDFSGLRFHRWLLLYASRVTFDMSACWHVRWNCEHILIISLVFRSWKGGMKSWALFFRKGLMLQKKGSYWGKIEGLTSRIVKSLCGSDFTSIWALF